MPANKRQANATTQSKRDWSDMQHRLDGKDDFVAELRRPGNAALRKRCVEDPVFARAKFAELGKFQLEESADTDPAIKPIPSDTVIRIFENDRAAREKLVTIILDPKPFNEEPVLLDWRCTYAPYAENMTRNEPERKSAK